MRYNKLVRDKISVIIVLLAFVLFSLLLLGCSVNSPSDETEQAAIARDIENCFKLEEVHKEGVSAGNYITYPREECLSGKASYWGKVEICNGISNLEGQAGCYNKIAVHDQNPELCRGERDIRLKCMQWSVGNKI